VEYEQNEALDDSDFSSVDEDDRAAGNYIANVPANTRRNRRWGKLEEQKLWAWGMEKIPWREIFRRLPDRTPAAVRLRFYMLQKAKAAEVHEAFVDRREK
jgi:hypothetical protein